MANNIALMTDEEFEEWLVSQVTNPAPDAAPETTLPDMTTEVPSVSAVSITNAEAQVPSTQAIQGNNNMQDIINELSATFMANPQWSGPYHTISPYQNFFAGGSDGTHPRPSSYSRSTTKTESLAAFKPVTSPVTGDLKGSVKMMEVSTKPSRSTKKKAPPTLTGW